MPDPVFYELKCPDCQWQEVCGAERIAFWLRKACKLRAGREPEVDILYELFRAAAGEWACPRCQHVGLIATLAVDDGDWPGDVPCAACRRPIPAERRTAVPGVKLCAACQSREESGGTASEPEFCPHCGAFMELRLSKAAGLTRYVMTCTGCKRGLR